MKVNGYEIGKEPTNEEMAVYMGVKRFLMREWIAGWLEGQEPLSQDGFETLVHRYMKLDFSAEELQALEYEYELLTEERS